MFVRTMLIVFRHSAELVSRFFSHSMLLNIPRVYSERQIAGMRIEAMLESEALGVIDT